MTAERPGKFEVCETKHCDRWTTAPYCCVNCKTAHDGGYEIDRHTQACSYRWNSRRPGNPRELFQRFDFDIPDAAHEPERHDE